MWKYYYKFSAIFDYFIHKIRGHEVYWRVNVDELCSGDIVCETCNLIIWCRAND